MGILFGTDGIRGFANKYPMDCETSIKVGRAIAEYFGNRDGSAPILIGSDTRISGPMIINAVVSGICSMGLNVVLAGVIPTPGIAYLVSKGNFCAGVVISASHNNFYDNGIKLFDESGCKLSDFAEAVLEKMIDDPIVQNKSQEVRYMGQTLLFSNPLGEYTNFLENSCFDFSAIAGMKIVLDCSNGATSVCAPMIFNKFGVDITTLFCSPNGININNNCGSEHPKAIAEIVLSKGADIGLSFDGDGDRVVAVSELGEILTGDQLLAIFANDLKKLGFLKNNTIVSTVMSNFGLGIALKKMGIKHIRSDVGDKCVAKKMFETGTVLGGENSGHIIFANHQSIGDAIFAGLYLLAAVKRSGLSLSQLSKIMQVTPQYLISVDVSSKPDFSKISDIKYAIAMIEKKLGNKGRLFVRYSGTQSKCRVMVESDELGKAKKYCKYISEVISKNLS